MRKSTVKGRNLVEFQNKKYEIESLPHEKIYTKYIKIKPPFKVKEFKEAKKWG
jgi:hypothetical protein